MSTELRISAYKRGGGLLCRAEKRFSALATVINMPFTGDWLIFEGSGKTYRGEVVGREIRYGEEASQTLGAFTGWCTGLQTEVATRNLAQGYQEPPQCPNG
jgi:hypothetical protein